jgi:hypothetical protein
LNRCLDAAIVLVAAALFLIIALGGIDYTWGMVHIRLHSVFRPLVLLVALLATRAWVFQIDARWLTIRGLVALLLTAAAVYATYHVRVCGGLDSYGYVSTSALIASGHLSEPQPLLKYLPFEDASNAAAPLGYVRGAKTGTEVPRFPLGLPLVMALFRILGPDGPFFVPLLMGYATLVLAFMLVRDSSPDVVIALFAAAIVAVDPLLAYYAMQPMSDVPAACWLLAAVWLRLSDRARSAGLAGFCAGMAFLTRPALLPAVVAIGIVTFDRPLKESIRYGLVVTAFVIVQMFFNLELYGNARSSGYGPASLMFELSWSRLAANAANFGKWLTYSHSILIWLLWPAALAVLRHRRWAWQISVVAAAAGAPYLFYLVFDDWESSRFLLPTILMVLILAATAVGETMVKVRATPVLFAIALACAAASHTFLRNEGAYRFADLEAKYALAGEWIEAHTSANAVVFAGLHSGSIRYYGHRQTIRWDQIPPDKMSVTVHNLEAAGYEPYVALDMPSEPPLFAERFRGDPDVRTEQIGRIRVVNFYRFVPAQ